MICAILLYIFYVHRYTLEIPPSVGWVPVMAISIEECQLNVAISGKEWLCYQCVMF